MSAWNPVSNLKAARPWLIVSGAVAAAAALILGLALLPSVQRRVLLWIASVRPGLTLDVDHVAIRPGMTEIRGLHLQQEGIDVTVEQASFGISLWQAAVHRRIILHNARVTGMKVDLTRAGPAVEVAGAGAPEPGQPGASAPGVRGVAIPAASSPDAAAVPEFSGILSRFHLPCEVDVDACEVAADIVLPRAAGKPPGDVRVRIVGGHFGPKRNAEFNFDATIRNPDPGTPVDEVVTRGVLTATLDGRSAVERVSIHLDAAAHGPLVPAAASLQADLALGRTPAGEAYTVALNSIEDGTVSRLLDLDGDYIAGSSTLTGRWRIQANHRQVAPFVFGFAVPEFSVSGDGRFEVSFLAGTQQLSGRLTGNASRLEVIDPRLRELDGLGVGVTFDLRHDRGQLRVADLAAEVKAGKPVLSVQAVQAFTVNLATGDIAPSGAQRELVRINLAGVPMAWIRSFFPGVGLSGEQIEGQLVAALHGAGRVWLQTTSALSVHGFAISQGGRVVLPASDLSLDAEVERSRDGTRVRLTNLSFTTAAGDQLDGQGELAVKPDRTIAVQASFDATLPTLARTYVPAGPLIAHGSTAFSRSGEVIQVDRMEAHLATADGRPLVDLFSPEGFRVVPSRRQITTLTGKPGEVFRVKYGRIPLDVREPWSGFVELKGELTDGEFVLRMEGEGLRMAAASPFRLEGVSATGGGVTLLRDLVVETDPSFDYSPQGATARLAGLRVKNPKGDVLLSAHAGVAIDPDFTNLRFQGTTSFELSLPALAGQPLMAGLEPPRQGRLTGNSKFSFDHDLLGEGRLTLNGLVSPATGEALPVANLSFRAGLNEQGDIAVRAPVLVDRAGERSDLTLAATLRLAPGGRTADVKISGEHFALDDVLVLLGAFSPANGAQTGAHGASGQAAPAKDPAAAETNTAEPAPTGVPAWNGLTGQVQFDVKSIEYGRFPKIVGLKGRAVIEPRRIVLENVTAQVGEENGRLELDGEIRCGEGGPRPYGSKFLLEVKGFDMGAIFKAVDPDKPPTIEGLFDLHLRAEGDGRTPGELVRRTRGEFVFQSRKGVSRLLERRPPAPPRSTGIVSDVTNTAARLIDNIGDKVGKIVSYTDPTDEIAGMLAEVQFDQLNVRVSSDPSANIRLADFSLVSPVLRLKGEGVIAHDPDKPMFGRPLKLTLSLGVMGKVEKVMTQAKAPMLSSSRDDLGYLKSSDTFEVAGTPDRPDPGQLYTMVARSMIGKLLH